MNHAVMAPARAFSDAAHLALKNPFNPLSYTPIGRNVAAACELFERTTRRYVKPEFGLRDTLVGGERVGVHEEVVWKKPFCNLLHFRRDMPAGHEADSSRVLIVAPM